nr:MAG TPA: hypothetical protein [Inoviridae sp.]
MPIIWCLYLICCKLKHTGIKDKNLSAIKS